jgi:hypothetical protein
MINQPFHREKYEGQHHPHRLRDRATAKNLAQGTP